METPTPGPWVAEYRGRETYISGPKWHRFAKVYRNDDDDELDRIGIANARLIAASSDLLDAIVDALNDFEDYGLHAPECDCTYCNGIAKLRQAYRKATNA